MGAGTSVAGGDPCWRCCGDSSVAGHEAEVRVDAVAVRDSSAAATAETVSVPATPAKSTAKRKVAGSSKNRHSQKAHSQKAIINTTPLKLDKREVFRTLEKAEADAREIVAQGRRNRVKQMDRARAEVAKEEAHLRNALKKELQERDAELKKEEDDADAKIKELERQLEIDKDVWRTKIPETSKYMFDCVCRTNLTLPDNDREMLRAQDDMGPFKLPDYHRSKSLLVAHEEKLHGLFPHLRKEAPVAVA
eukprot:GHVU01126788.1.p1 GENE.GHVU01126788.1~~GHVU01126788.1.p1  ORF type:complete len:249 (-),score=46.19 GHVU01126788.1:595-1341(-)